MQCLICYKQRYNLLLETDDHAAVYVGIGVIEVMMQTESSLSLFHS